ncbi:unnamed protein product, partial [Rotaria magnacalcarata]
SKQIADFINEHFVIWLWVRTNMNNYRQLLKLLISWIGSKAASYIVTNLYSIDHYPLFVCLSFQSDEFIVDNDRDRARRTVEEIRDLDIQQVNLIQIQKVENIIWLIEYLRKRKSMNDRIGFSSNEKILYYKCPSSQAPTILKYGFSHKSDQINGDKYGCRFCFSSKCDVYERYTFSDETKSDKKAIIACRVLVGTSCIGNSNLKTCPVDCNSMTDGSTTFVVHSNRQILPLFLVIYNK